MQQATPQQDQPQRRDDKRPVFRFAPSPNGFLHRGHAYSALLNHRLALRFGGRFLLRIEDIDLARCKDAYIETIYDDLHWLGLSWEEPVRRQSHHFADYKAVVQKLSALGLLYPCYASRTEIAAASVGRDPDGAPLRWRDHPVIDADEEDRRREAGKPFALHLDMRRALSRIADLRVTLDYPVFSPTGEGSHAKANPARWGDVVLVRKDTPTSYHLSVVVDDALQGVTHIVRGRDLEAATDVHRLLQALLDLPVPAYHHHDLLLDADGGKLAKSRSSYPLHALREAGMDPRDLLTEPGFATLI